jgi:Flp pilus assembly protein TadD
MGRFEAANRVFSRHGLKWEVSMVLDWKIDSLVVLEDARRLLAGNIGKGAIVVGFVTGPRGDALGAEVPFDPRVVVVDDPARPESFNTAVLCHQLGHVLGAWHSGAANSILHDPPGAVVDDDAVAVLGVTRQVDFLKGAEGLSADQVAALSRLWVSRRASPGTNPLGLYYSAAGREVTARAGPGPAIQPFARAVVFEPANFEYQMALGIAQASTRHYHDAVRTFATAVSLDPMSIAALNAQGASLAQLGRWSEAAGVFRRAVSLRPSDLEMHARLGAVLINVPGQQGTALAELKHVLEQDAENELALQAIAILSERSRPKGPDGAKPASANR